MSRTRRGARDGGVPTWTATARSTRRGCRENSATIDAMRVTIPRPRRRAGSLPHRRRTRSGGVRRGEGDGGGVSATRVSAEMTSRRLARALRDIARGASASPSSRARAPTTTTTMRMMLRSPSRDPRHGVLARGAHPGRARRDDREGRAARRAAARDHDADRARDPRRAEGPLGVPRRAVASDPQFLNHRARRPRQGAFFFTLVPIRPRSRGERRSLRTFAVVSLRPPLAFNPRPRRLSTPTDAFEHHPAIASYGTTTASRRSRTDSSR